MHFLSYLPRAFFVPFSRQDACTLFTHESHVARLQGCCQLCAWLLACEEHC